MITYCTHCKKKLSSGAKSLCSDCYLSRSKWIKKKEFVCSNCGKKTQHVKRKMCIKCYGKTTSATREFSKKTCLHCGKKLSIGASNLCLECYRTRVQWRGEKKITCRSCGKIAKQAGHGYCRSCYFKKFMRKYHAEHERQRRKEQADHINALDRKRNQKPERKEQRRIYAQKYYAKNKEKLLKYQSDYRRADPERRDNYKRRDRARRQNLPDTLTVKQWHKILDDHNHACYYCGRTGVKLEREHKIPAIKGGGYTADNIVPACGSCNRHKRTMTDKEFREYVKKYL